MNNKYFKLYGNCFIVKGSSESIIYDLERESYYPIPIELGNILFEIDSSEVSIENLEAKYNEDSTIVMSFINQLIDKELGHIVSDPKSFPKICLDWKSPYKIENAIIEFSEKSKYNINSVLTQLEEFGCQAIEFRFLTDFKPDYLSKIFDRFLTSNFKYYLIAINYNAKTLIEEYKVFANKYQRISRIIIFIGDNNREYKKLMNSISLKSRVILLNKTLTSNMVEKVSLSSFIINTSTFVEAQSHNIGLNKKICISKNGEIKNFLTHKRTYGNVKDINLKEVIESDEFQYLWKVSNDSIEKCKDCQYRYMCLCNSDIESKDGKFYKLSTCDYDPYENVWA